MHSNVQLLYLLLFFDVVVAVAVAVLVTKGPYYHALSAMDTLVAVSVLGE